MCCDSQFVFVQGNYDAYVQTRYELEENQMKQYKWEQDQVKHMKVGGCGVGASQLTAKGSLTYCCYGVMLQSELVKVHDTGCLAVSTRNNDVWVLRGLLFLKIKKSPHFNIYFIIALTCGNL